MMIWLAMQNEGNSWPRRPGVRRVRARASKTKCPGLVIAYYQRMYRLTQAWNGLATGFSATKADLVKAADKLAVSGFDFTKSTTVKVHIKNWNKASHEVKCCIADALKGLGVTVVEQIS